MTPADQLLDRTTRALTRPFRLPHQASSVARDLFELAHVHGLVDDPRFTQLRGAFDGAVAAAGIDDLLAHQLRYASRLAAAPEPLTYEEMHKLLSLCDEIHALRSLGFSSEPALIDRFEADVRDRFVRQRREAHLAAEDKALPWNRTLWWYSETL